MNERQQTVQRVDGQEREQPVAGRVLKELQSTRAVREGRQVPVQQGRWGTETSGGVDDSLGQVLFRTMALG